MVQKKLLHNVDQELLFFKFSTAVEHNSGGRVFFFLPRSNNDNEQDLDRNENINGVN